MKLFKLTEIGYNYSIETEKSLIEIAHEHCGQYDDERVELLPIDTLEKAINYFMTHAFTVEEYNGDDMGVCVSCGTVYDKYDLADTNLGSLCSSCLRGYTSSGERIQIYL